MHRGPASKANKLGKSASADWTEVADVPYTGASPDLPKLPRNRKWSEHVVLWWEQVRSMPHCVLWQPGDWQFAVETALMKDAFWREYEAGEMKGTMATEIRRREAQIGTTREACRQLRIRYVPAEQFDGYTDEIPEIPVVSETGVPEPGVATVTPLNERRARLSAAREQAV